jgi:TetR/AcrR family transcriptional repressor of mexJK operon
VSVLTETRPRACPESARRHQLIEVAEEIFLERGYHAATVDDIARRAGMSKKTIYVMFESKAALFDALLSARLAPLAEPIPDDGRSLAQILVEFLSSVAHLVLSPRQIALTRLMIAESPRSPDVVRALRSQAVCNGDGALETWLAQQVRRGTLALCDPREAASMLFGMSIGELALRQLVKGEPMPSEDELARRIELSVHMFLAAHAQTPASAESSRRSRVSAT